MTSLISGINVVELSTMITAPLTGMMLADWGAAGSLCESLWTATESAPNTTSAASITAATGAVFACNILPTFPSVGGSAPDAQTVSLSFQVVGTPTETFS